MLKKSLFTATLLFAALGAQAQSTPTPAPAPTPAKAELTARLLKLQLPGVQVMARDLVAQPVAEMMDRVDAALPVRVEPAKREAVAREIQADAKKYMDEALPLVRDRAMQLAPATVGAFLNEKFTEDELRQVIAVMESAAWIKFQRLAVEMQNSLQEKLVADTSASIEPKLKALEQSVARRLGVKAPAAR